MGLRHLVIEQPSLDGKAPPCLMRVQVSDETPIGPWVSTLAARLGYPLFDSFGSPLPYQLRTCSSEKLLPTSGTFAQVRFHPDEHFVLEVASAARPTRPLSAKTMPRQSGRRATLSRRMFLGVGGSFAFVSCLGLSSGMATAIMLRKHAPSSVAGPRPVTLSLPVTVARHGQPIAVAAWSPDGTHLASGGHDALVRIWTPDGTLLHTLAFEATVRALAFSPSGTSLMVGAGHVVSFFDARSATLLSVDALAHTAQVTGLAWTQTKSPLAVSVGEDKQAIVWDGQSLRPRLVFGVHTTPIEAVSTCAEVVATASAGGVCRVWSALSGREVHGYFSENARPQRAIAFSSTGMLALGGDDGLVCLWQDGRGCGKQTAQAFGNACVDVPQHLVEHTRAIRAAAFSPDGTLLATGGDDTKLVLWSVRDRVPLLTQSVPQALVSLAWSGDRLVAASGREVLLWQVQGNR